ncbi:hypothetical protein [uncultured Veillonella sp.]|uniref:hypothetical protein n=1 Tax=uncultured Veillonella sp. TaxID=159268 RepID=UPI002618AB1C|nr:hypothetical protein [uncultured Veillonella sp.]
MDNQNEFFGLPLPERLMQTQELKGSGAFYELYKDSVETAETVFKENGAYIEELKAKLDECQAEVAHDANESERRQMIDRSVSDIAHSNSLVLTALNAYGDAANKIKVLEEGGFAQNYILQRKIDLVKQNTDFNILLTTLTNYMQIIINALESELAVTDSDTVAVQPGGAEGEAQQTASEEAKHVEQLSIYQSWLQQTYKVNTIIERRFIFIEALLRALKVDLTNLQVHKMEQDVQERKQAIANQRYKKTLEDVRDYDDLEGQYRHQYDEDGNLIETVQGGEGGNKRGIMVAATLLGLVIIAMAIYILVK